MGSTKRKEKKRRCTRVKCLSREENLMSVALKDRGGIFKMILTKWKEKGRSMIVLVIKWILLTFITGLVENWYEPIYRSLTPSFFLQEEEDDTDSRTVISVNTEIQVRIYFINDYMEHTYEVDEENCQEGIEQSENEVNSKKSSDEEWH